MFKKYGKQNILDLGIVPIRYLSSGASGDVYEIQPIITGLEHAHTIMKIEKIDKSHKDVYNIAFEVFMQNRFHDVGISPEMSNFNIFKHKNSDYTAIIMEEVPYILENYLKVERTNEILEALLEQIYHILDIMCENDLVHGDMHGGNMALTYSFEDETNIPDPSFAEQPLTVKLIDLGWASPGKCNRQLELAQLIRTTEFITNKKNKKYLRQKLIERYNTLFPNTPLSVNIRWEGINKIFTDLHYQYQNQIFFPALERFNKAGRVISRVDKPNLKRR